MIPNLNKGMVDRKISRFDFYPRDPPGWGVRFSMRASKGAPPGALGSLNRK